MSDVTKEQAIEILLQSAAVAAADGKEWMKALDVVAESMEKLKMIEEIVKPPIYGQWRMLMAIQDIREICFGAEIECDESGE